MQEVSPLVAPDWTFAVRMIVLVSALAIAVRCDLLENRIPNALTLPTFATGLTLAVVDGPASATLAALSGAAIGLCVLLPFHLMRGMGAGDVKLMAAVGTLLGPSATFLATGLVLIAGAAIGVAIAGRARLVAGKTGVLKRKFPYAIAIAVGSLGAAIVMHREFWFTRVSAWPGA
jgi:prepilin peptidase CpaA